MSASTLVIDACIARSSGDEDATFPTAKYCRDFLLFTRDSVHKAGFSVLLRLEWNKHQSKFARTWMVSMFARRKIVFTDIPKDENLRKQLARVNADAGCCSLMLKDAHLIEAAFAFDRIVFSIDDTVRFHFKNASSTVTALQDIVWVNPLQDFSETTNWLAGGASKDKRTFADV